LCVLKIAPPVWRKEYISYYKYINLTVNPKILPLFRRKNSAAKENELTLAITPRICSPCSDEIMLQLLKNALTLIITPIIHSLRSEKSSSD